jgi:hypothetical protein
MSDQIERKTEQTTTTVEKRESDPLRSMRKPAWETPKLEDVSEQVMAQPYIRFT